MIHYRLMLTFVITAHVTAVGSGTAFASTDSIPAKPTFSKDVAPILFDNCVTCHRPGQTTPMSLRSFEEARPWVKSILKNVTTGVMPPWKVDEGYGPWKDNKRLSDVEIGTIERWIKQGSKEGDSADLPALPEFPPADEWQLGEPDYIITFGTYDVPAEGTDHFHDFFAKTEFPEDRWIRAMEVKPGDPSVVHHMILWSGDGSPNNSQGWLGAWAAGASPMVFPEGMGKILSKDAVLRGDMHYHPSGTAATDQTRVGLYFADKDEVEKELVNLWVMNAEFLIPAGDPNYEARSNHTFSQDSHIISLAPHMHYRGKDFLFKAHYPDGNVEDLLKVSEYDFNWQSGFEFETPVSVPKGTRIECIAHFDNSESNPNNPDPSRDIAFGLQSEDEMLIGFVDYIVDEGVSPREQVNPVLVKIDELVAKFPSEVFKFENRRSANGPVEVMGIHLPREGDGGWYVPVGTFAGRARLYDFVWDDMSFECKMAIPGQKPQGLSGTIDAENGLLNFTMHDGSGNTSEGQAEMVK